MRFIKTFLFLFAALTVFLTACEKADPLPFYGTGVAPTLSASATTIAPQTADSNNVALRLNWTYPNHATDTGNIKYTIEIDSAGKNFANPVRREVMGRLSDSLLAKELNNILLSKGYAFGKQVDMDVRVVSSYANNNERLPSNTLRIKMTPYKVPPKVAPPTSETLFLVGSATPGGWNNPVPVPAQRFTRIDSVTYEGTFYLKGGGEYLILPVNNNNWDNKYSVANNTAPGLNAGGAFGLNLRDNIPGPANTGLYRIRLDFQTGTFSVVQVREFAQMYVPGDYQGWAPATAPTLASPNNNGNYEGYVNIPTGNSFEFKLTPGPGWDNALGDGGNGTLSGSGGNLKVPGAGYYRIRANTVDNTWSVLKTTWGLVGNHNSWGDAGPDVQMTFNSSDNTWTGTLTTSSAGEFKFRANGSWDLNYGDKGADGSLEEGGDNIPIPAGTHTITLYLNNAGYYTYKIQ